MPFDPLERRAIGKTQLTVTRMGLGGAPLGERQVRVSDEQANAIIQQAYAQGLRHFDTAPWYGQGKSELRMGRNLVDKPRADFAVSTKVGRVFFRPAHPETFEPPWLGGGNRFDFRWDYSYDGVMRSYEDSKVIACVSFKDQAVAMLKKVRSAAPPALLLRRSKVSAAPALPVTSIPPFQRSTWVHVLLSNASPFYVF
jgi:hypothetical protein